MRARTLWGMAFSLLSAMTLLDAVSGQDPPPRPEISKIDPILWQPMPRFEPLSAPKPQDTSERIWNRAIGTALLALILGAIGAAFRWRPGQKKGTPTTTSSPSGISVEASISPVVGLVSYKFVECEQCKQKYVYGMNREAQDHPTECKPVPCPECGWYQRQMVEWLRGQHKSWMLLTGGLLFVPFIICALIGYLAFVDIRPEPETGVFWLIAAGLILASALGLIFCRRYLARRLQLNDAPQEDRIQSAKGKAMKADEFDLWRQGGEVRYSVPQKLSIRD